MQTDCLARRGGPSVTTSVLNYANRKSSTLPPRIPHHQPPTTNHPPIRTADISGLTDGALCDRGIPPGPNECRHSSSQPATRGIEQHVRQTTLLQSKTCSTKLTSLLPLSGLALYRALLRRVPPISLPDELTSRPGWTNPIRFLIRNGFRRNRTDTSPRLITSALKSGYRFLALLTRASDASSSQHSQVITFLRDRQNSFPPPRAPPPPPTKPERAPPLLTRTSPPGRPPVYASTFRPRPLAELSGGKRKVPVLDAKDAIAFLRIGKPQSHRHANFVRRKADRRQARITALQGLEADDRPAAAAEDEWEMVLGRFASAEGVRIDDEGEAADTDAGMGARGRSKAGPFEHIVMQFGFDYIGNKLSKEAADMIARATAMLDIVDEEKRLAAQEKEENRQRRQRAWEERQGKQEQGNDQKELE